MKTAAKKADPSKTIAFQGQPGAFSELACKHAYPSFTALPCASFEDLFAAVEDGRAHYAMTPIDNSIAGRVADIHRLLPHAKLHIVGEHYERIEHCLLGLPGTSLKDIHEVYSHVHALGQCRTFLHKHHLAAIVHADTAGAAADVTHWGDRSKAAIASSAAAEHYGLSVLKKNIEDEKHNTTRFVILAKTPARVDPRKSPVLTSIFFRVRSIPAALYKAIGGFATAGVNLTKIESYLAGPDLSIAQFYVEVEGHPSEIPMKHALEELSFFSDEIRIMGSYYANPLEAKVSSKKTS